MPEHICYDVYDAALRGLICALAQAAGVASESWWLVIEGRRVRMLQLAEAKEAAGSDFMAVREYKEEAGKKQENLFL